MKSGLPAKSKWNFANWGYKKHYRPLIWGANKITRNNGTADAGSITGDKDVSDRFDSRRCR